MQIKPGFQPSQSDSKSRVIQTLEHRVEWKYSISKTSFQRLKLHRTLACVSNPKDSKSALSSLWPFLLLPCVRARCDRDVARHSGNSAEFFVLVIGRLISNFLHKTRKLFLSGRHFLLEWQAEWVCKHWGRIIVRCTQLSFWISLPLQYLLEHLLNYSCQNLLVTIDIKSIK